MDIRQLSDSYSVSPQITCDQVSDIAAAGFKTVICNRPDTENPGDLHMCEIEEAVKKAGMAFYDNPFDARTFGPDAIATQRKLLDTVEGPVLAYCASGNRCSIVWAFTQAGHLPTDQIVEAVENAGYPMAHMRLQLDGFAQS